MTTFVPPPTTREPRLSAAMRDGSAEQHRAAEDSAFVTDLLAGRLDRQAYAAYLACLRAVYAALESVVREQAHDPVVAAVHDPGLERLDALDLDLAFWRGATADGAAQDPGVLDPARPYVAHLELLRGAAPGRLVAHHYTRYLGDLSGGRVIGRVLARTYGLGPGTGGLAFYDFPAVPKPKVYKDDYRARLDALELAAEDRVTVVSEVRTAFDLNRAMLRALGALHPPTAATGSPARG